MAYLGTDAAARSNGEYGRGGCGEIDLRWHNMPDATVVVLPAGDIRGHIEIRWRLEPTFEGMFADLTIEEARRLRAELTTAISVFDGPAFSGVTDNEVDDAVTVNGDGTVLTLEDEPVFCRGCDGRVWLVSNGFEHFWTHEPYSINDHEPMPTGFVSCASCGGRIEWVTEGVDRWWTHEVLPADCHDAVPGRVTARVIGEVA